MSLRLGSVLAFALMVAGLVWMLVQRVLLARNGAALAVQIAAVLLMIWARITFGRRASTPPPTRPAAAGDDGALRLPPTPDICRGYLLRMGRRDRSSHGGRRGRSAARDLRSVRAHAGRRAVAGRDVSSIRGVSGPDGPGRTVPALTGSHGGVSTSHSTAARWSCAGVAGLLYRFKAEPDCSAQEVEYVSRTGRRCARLYRGDDRGRDLLPRLEGQVLGGALLPSQGFYAGLHHRARRRLRRSSRNSTSATPR